MASSLSSGVWSTGHPEHRRSGVCDEGMKMSRSKQTAQRPEDTSTKSSSGRVAKGRAAREQVDAIFSQWQAERPDIDTSPVHVYGFIGPTPHARTRLIQGSLG